MNLKALVGLSESEAIAEIKKNNLRPRVRRRDDERFTVTMDFRMDRVNLEIDQGKVTRAYIG